MLILSFLSTEKDNPIVIRYIEPIGGGIIDFEEKRKELREKFEKRLNEIKNELKKEKIQLKEGIYHFGEEK